MIKLSTLKDTDILLANDFLIEKEDLVNHLEDYKEYKIYTTTQYEANISALDMIERAIENESQDMYEGWYESIVSDIIKEDISEIRQILDRILSRNKHNNITYFKDKEVEIDI